MNHCKETMDNDHYHQNAINLDVAEQLLNIEEDSKDTIQRVNDEDDLNNKDTCISNSKETEIQNVCFGSMQIEEVDSKDAFKHRLFHTACLCSSGFAMVSISLSLIW